MSDNVKKIEKDEIDYQKRKAESDEALINYAKFIAAMIEKYQSILFKNEL